MRRIKSTDMKPEMIVRRLLHGAGYRYRLHSHALPGRPDIVFQKRRKIVFVHGCFWHQHPECKLAHRPKSNLDYWKPKLLMNRKRDRKNLRALQSSGWSVIVLWECELGDEVQLFRRLKVFLGPLRF